MRVRARRHGAEHRQAGIADAAAFDLVGRGLAHVPDREVQSQRDAGQPLLPGATILIRLQAFDAPGQAPCERGALRTTALGEVKWCRELSGTATGWFGVGVRYHFPV